MFIDNKFMAEKKILLQGKIPEKLKHQIDETIETHRFNVTQLVEAMAELWVSLPESIQVDLYSRKVKGLTLESIVEKIVSEKISEVIKGVSSGKRAQEFADKALKHTGKLHTPSKVS